VQVKYISVESLLTVASIEDILFRQPHWYALATQTVQLTMPTLSPSITIAAHNETSFNPPYQIKWKSKQLGRHLSGSKLWISFQFGFIVDSNTVANYRNEEHEVVLIWSHFTGKRQLFMDGKKIHMTKSPRPVSLSQASSGRFEYWWIIPGNHVLKIITNGILPFPSNRSKRFDLEIDGVSYFDLHKLETVRGISNLRSMKSDQPEVTAPFSNLKDNEVEHLQLDEILGELGKPATTRSIPSMIGGTLTSTTSFESSYCDSTAPRSNNLPKSRKIIESSPYALYRSNRFLFSPKECVEEEHTNGITSLFRFLFSPKECTDKEQANEMTTSINNCSSPEALVPLLMVSTPPTTSAPTVASIPIVASSQEQTALASIADSIPIVETKEEVSLVESIQEIVTKKSYEQSCAFFRCPMTESISLSSSSSSSASLFSTSLSSESWSSESCSSVSASTSGKVDSFTTLTTPINQTDSLTTFTFEEPKSSNSTQASFSLAGWILTVTRQLKKADKLVEEKQPVNKQKQPRVIVEQPDHLSRSEGVDFVQIQ
jgi:hypothetical protein